MNDALVIGIVLTLVFGAIIFYLYNRLSMTERKMGLVEGVLTDLKIMMDAAPFASGVRGQDVNEFEPTSEYLNAISGPIPLQKDEVEEALPEEEFKEMKSSVSTLPLRSLQIDETAVLTSVVPSISVTKLSPDLDSLTVKELNGVAKERGISVPAGTRRRELIELLNKASDASSEQGVGLQAPSEATRGIQGSLLVSFDGPEPPVDGSRL